MGRDLLTRTTFLVGTDDLLDSWFQGRIESQRFGEVLFGLSILAQTQTHQSTVRVSLGEMRVEFNCSTKVGNGSVQVAFVRPHHAAKIIGRGPERLEFNRPLKISQGSINISFTPANLSPVAVKPRAARR